MDFISDTPQQTPNAVNNQWINDNIRVLENNDNGYLTARIDNIKKSISKAANDINFQVKLKQYIERYLHVIEVAKYFNHISDNPCNCSSCQEFLKYENHHKICQIKNQNCPECKMFYTVRDFHVKFCANPQCKYRVCREQFATFVKYVATRNQKKSDLLERIIKHTANCGVSKCSIDYCKKMKFAIAYEKQQRQIQLQKQQQQQQQQQNNSNLNNNNNNNVAFLSIPESNSSLSTQPLPSSQPMMHQQQMSHSMMQQDMSLLSQQQHHHTQPPPPMHQQQQQQQYNQGYMNDIHSIQPKYNPGYMNQHQPLPSQQPQLPHYQQQSLPIRQNPLYSNPTDPYQPMKTSLYKTTTQLPYGSSSSNNISLNTTLSKYNKMSQRMSTPSTLPQQQQQIQQQQHYTSMLNPLQQMQQQQMQQNPFNPYTSSSNSKNIVDQIARSQKRKRITENVEPLKKEYVDRIAEEDKWNGKNCIFDPKDFIQMIYTSIPSNMLICSCKIFNKRNHSCKECEVFHETLYRLTVAYLQHIVYNYLKVNREHRRINENKVIEKLQKSQDESLKLSIEKEKEISSIFKVDDNMIDRNNIKIIEKEPKYGGLSDLYEVLRKELPPQVLRKHLETVTKYF